MNILLIGNGAREHAIAWKISKSRNLKKLYVAPGNAGTMPFAENLDIKLSGDNFSHLIKECKSKSIDLVVVGPEAPLSEGIVNSLNKNSIPVFGPTKEAAQIESSKIFSKELMLKYGIPCARSAAFSDPEEAIFYIKKQIMPIVIKADGLAAGKGVIIAKTIDEAKRAISDFMEKRILGDAGNNVLVEDFLNGIEVSLLAFTDGKTIIPMVPACDYKRIYDGDLGPNTGGMGSYSPPKFFTKNMLREVYETIIKPTVNGMEKEGCPYKGVLYTGLMITDKGIKVLEYNARFGDPETQVILPRLNTDLVQIMMSIVDGKLGNISIEWMNDACVGVVIASGGYPSKYQTGYPITGLDKLDPDIMVFHAGTKIENGKVHTSGGRVLTVTASGKTMADARNRVYRNLPHIQFQNAHFRNDIAARELD
ncbi:MAG: phosphoribosylamine--glycine ligase [Chloroflexi bacterium]|nr:phosphoribosylamine--glycine ligase [Chloroflexota bacterium]